MCYGLDGGHNGAQFVPQIFNVIAKWLKVEGDDHLETLHWYHFDCQGVEARYDN